MRYQVNFTEEWVGRITAALGKEGVTIEKRLEFAIKKAVGQAELDKFSAERQQVHEDALRARAKQIEDEINEDEG